MVRIMMILLGVEYLRERWRGVLAAGAVSALVGAALFIDALDGVLYFHIAPFAWLLLIEGLATLAVAWTGMGGQRTLRYVKGFGFCMTAVLVLSGYRHASFIISMVFATLFLADGLLQIASAWVVRYRTWRLAAAGGELQIAIAIFLYQPYPTHYKGTVPYGLGLILMFAGWNLLLLALRARRFAVNPAACRAAPLRSWRARWARRIRQRAQVRSSRKPCSMDHPSRKSVRLRSMCGRRWVLRSPKRGASRSSTAILPPSIAMA